MEQDEKFNRSAALFFMGLCGVLLLVALMEREDVPPPTKMEVYSTTDSRTLQRRINGQCDQYVSTRLTAIELVIEYELQFKICSD